MICIKDTHFSYGRENTSKFGLTDINLTIRKGECIVLCGKSGCGKTSLTRLINGLIPHFYEGDLRGEVLIEGQNIKKMSLAQISTLVGSVFQNPSSQFFNVDTMSELAFGCENLAMPVDVIMKRIAEVTEKFGLDQLLDKSIFELSGGEKQRIACASVYATFPDIFVLDEPSSNLDPLSIDKLKDVLTILKAMGKTLIVSEHRLYYLKNLGDRFIYMKDGFLDSVYTQAEMGSLELEKLREKGLRTLGSYHCGEKKMPTKNASVYLGIEDMSFYRGKKEILNIKKLQIAQKEIVGIIGENGAGKSTFINCLSGLLRHKGSVFIEGKAIKSKKRLKKSYMVMQDVNHQLFCENVKEEVGLNSGQSSQRIDDILQKMNLAQYKEVHPLALSGGEKQRVAIASAICSGKSFLFYDEPTSGLDYWSMNATCDLIRLANETATLSLIVTHDLEFLLTCCTSVLHLENGKIKDYYSLQETEAVTKMKDYFMSKEVL